MTKTIDYREYENGVTDVLRYVAGGDVEIERDVRMRGRRSGTRRQIDVLVRGAMFGIADAMLAIDCKRWKTNLNVRHVETFVSMLDDIGADLGMLVTSAGYSANAKIRACAERGVRTEVLTLTELEQWAPAGTVHISYRVPADRAHDARAALVRAGLRVRDDRGLDRAEDQVILEAFRYPSGEAQPTLATTAAAALSNAGFEIDVAASGTSIGGGTPAHRWLEVTVDGHEAKMKILASTEVEVTDKLDQVAGDLRIPREALDVIRPAEWPVTGLFGLALARTA